MSKSNKSHLAIAYKSDQTKENSFFDKALKLTTESQKLPHSTSIEKAVIGGIIIDKNVFPVVDFLTEEDFYFDTHRLLYRTAQKLNAKNIPIDLLTVIEQLKEDGLLNSEKHKDLTPYGIVEITNTVASSANIEYHARILVQYKLKRKTLFAAHSILQAAWEDTTDIFELRDKAHRLFITAPPVDLFEAKTAQQTIEDSRSENPRKQLAGDLVKEKEIIFLFGDNGAGKSIFSVQLAQSIAAGSPVYPFLNNECGPQKVLYYDFEVDDSGFADRYSNSDQGVDPKSNDYRYFPFHENFIRIRLNEKYIDFEEDAEKEIFTKIERDIIRQEAKVIIVDNVSYLSSADLQEAKPATAFMKKLIRLKNKHGVTVICIAHNTKITKGINIEKEHMGGSKQLSNLADAIIAIGKSSREDVLRYIKVVKRRYGENKYYTDNVILTNITKRDEFLHHEYIDTEDEGHHLEVIDRTDIESIKSQAIDRWKETGESPRKIKQRLNLDQSHPTIRKWIKEYKAKQQIIKTAPLENLDPEEKAFWQDPEEAMKKERNENPPF